MSILYNNLKLIITGETMATSEGQANYNSGTKHEVDGTYKMAGDVIPLGDVFLNMQDSNLHSAAAKADAGTKFEPKAPVVPISAGRKPFQK
jgi:hypothetical protein